MVNRYYKGSIEDALMDLYPNIGMDRQLFSTALGNSLPFVSSFNAHIDKHFHSAENRTAFFDEFAKNRGFDPLLADKWSTISKAEIMEEKVCQ